MTRKCYVISETRFTDKPLSLFGCFNGELFLAVPAFADLE
jgi:hypothetical protein